MAAAAGPADGAKITTSVKPLRFPGVHGRRVDRRGISRRRSGITIVAAIGDRYAMAACDAAQGG
jgi:hypothetical protein